MISRLALAAALTFALAACGSDGASEQPAGNDAATEVAVTPTEDAVPDVQPSETPTTAPSATPSPTASASPKPSATPKPMAAAAAPPEAFKQCTVCHSIEPGKTLIGPSLAGIYGTKAGEVQGFKFSPAMADSGLTWNAATLDTYLTDPKKLVPGTTMSFGGVKDDAKRAAIIAYLKNL